MKVIDRFGIERDAATDANIQYPAAQVLELALPKSSPNALREIKPIMQASKLYGDHADVYNDAGTKVMHRFVEGEGLYRVLDDGSVKKIEDTSLKNGSNKTPWVGDHQAKIYIGFLCTLMPHLGKVYLNAAGVDINHCIIPEIGRKAPAKHTEFFDIVDRGYNCRHHSFVKKYDLYNCPVSAFDLVRLERVFDAYGVSHPELDTLEEQEIWNLEEVFTNSDATSLKRKIITWWYFLKHHTDMNDRMWNVFREFLQTIFGDVRIPDKEEIQRCIEHYVKF